MCPPCTRTTAIKTDRWSHELRLSSKPGGSTHWTVGLYLEQTRDIYSDFYAYPGINLNGQAAQTALSYYDGATPLPSEWYSYSNQRTDNHQFATFGEITQDLTKQWSVIVGFRDFKSHDSSSDDWSGYFYQPKEPTPTESVSFSKRHVQSGHQLQIQRQRAVLFFLRSRVSRRRI